MSAFDPKRTWRLHCATEVSIVAVLVRHSKRCGLLRSPLHYISQLTGAATPKRCQSSCCQIGSTAGRAEGSLETGQPVTMKSGVLRGLWLGIDILALAATV